MLNFECFCGACTGGEDSGSRTIDFCLHCGQAVMPGDETMESPEGLLHSECLDDYCFTDATRDELLDFAEKARNDFRDYMTDLRNLRPAG